jgi:Domain of unknown function (DUF6268)
MRYSIAAVLLLFTVALRAQVTDTSAVDDMDYSKFGDAEGVKRYATQKVLNQTPNRIVSIGYEYQGRFKYEGPEILPNDGTVTRNVSKLAGLRAQINIPVISNTKLIWQVEANYMRSNFDIEIEPNVPIEPFTSSLNELGMHTSGINTTIFKPLNEKNFLIFQASADVNGVFDGFDEINSKAVTLSATAIYGWKKSEKNMIGVGVSRTYRAGQLIHVPVLLWNKTFNDKWGMELLLPARGHMRRNFSTSNILQLGFELEGNQYWMRTPSMNGQVFIQRGELKPRVMWDKKLKGFFWLNVQAGFRYNWRFDVMNEYDARKDNQLFFRSALTNPFYFSIGLNFVSP